MYKKYSVKIINIKEVECFLHSKRMPTKDLYEEICIKIKYVFNYKKVISFITYVYKFNLICLEIDDIQNKITYYIESIYNCYLEEIQYTYKLN